MLKVACLVGLVLSSTLSPITVAQDRAKPAEVQRDLLPAPVRPLDCELATRYLQDILERAGKEKNSTLIIIVKNGRENRFVWLEQESRM